MSAPETTALAPGRVLPLWRLYAYAVASFGLYLPVWVYQVARRQGAGSERRSTPVLWALGSFVPVVCMALLHHLAREAGGTRRTARVASLLLGAMALAWSLSPVDLFLVPVRST